MTRRPDDVPVPTLGAAFDAEQVAQREPEVKDRPKAASGWRASKAVPVVATVVSGLLLLRFADRFSGAQITALTLLVLIGWFFEHQYLNRR